MINRTSIYHNAYYGKFVTVVSSIAGEGTHG